MHVRALTFNGVQNVPLGPTNYPWAGGKVRVVVFKHHNQWRNSSETTLSDITIGGSGTNISETSMFLNPTNEVASISFPNLRECRYLYDKVHTVKFSSPHATSASSLTTFPQQPGMGTFHFKVNLKDIMYETTSGVSYIKDRQIYVAFIPTAFNPYPLPADDLFTIKTLYSLSYCDI